MEGWIKLHRSLQKWEWWNNDKMLRVFLTILLNANHEDGRWQGHEVKRGQWITGRKKLSDLTGFSQQQIRTILKRLEITQELTIKSTNRFSIITVIKWDSYQLEEKKSTSQLTNDQPATNQQLTTNKNVKKEKNEKKEQNIYPEWVNTELLKQFKQMRVKIKKSMTERAVELLISKLEKLKNEGHPPDEVMEQSILNSWAGVFPIKGKEAKRKRKPMFGIPDEV